MPRRSEKESRDLAEMMLQEQPLSKTTQKFSGRRTYILAASPPLPLRYVAQDKAVAWEIQMHNGSTKYTPRIGVPGDRLDVFEETGLIDREPTSEWSEETESSHGVISADDLELRLQGLHTETGEGVASGKANAYTHCICCWR